MRKALLVLCKVSLTLAFFPVVARCEDSPPRAQDKRAVRAFDELFARFEKIQDTSTVSAADRKALMLDVEEALHAAQAERAIFLQKYTRDVDRCLAEYRSCDLGDLGPEVTQRNFGVLDRAVLDCLSVADALPLEVEYRLVRQLQPVPPKKVVEVGSPASDRLWTSPREQVLERRLHLWRRLVNVIDPSWDPKKDVSINMSVVPPGDPKLRAEYDAALEANRKRNERNHEQRTARTILNEYLPRMKMAIAYAYNTQPSEKESLDRLQAYLQIYVTDEKVRGELFETAKSAAAHGISPAMSRKLLEDAYPAMRKDRARRPQPETSH